MPIFNQLTPTWLFGETCGALLVVGLLEFVKFFFMDKTTKKSKAPSWVWHIAMAIGCLVVSLLGGGGWSWYAIDAIGLMTMAQIGYQGLIKLPLALIRAAAEKAGGKIDDAPEQGQSEGA